MLKEQEYITEINRKILEMQEIIENTGDLVVSGLEKRPENLKNTLTELCKEAQIKEELIIEMCVEALIRYQPFASDLRALTVAMKVAYDLSRVCRYLRNITEILEEFGIDCCTETEIPPLVKDAKEMVRQALKAYFSKDSKLAARIIKSDDGIDARYRALLRKYASQKDLPGGFILFIGIVARIAERMADHAAYISHETIYLVTGRRVDYR